MEEPVVRVGVPPSRQGTIQTGASWICAARYSAASSSRYIATLLGLAIRSARPVALSVRGGISHHAFTAPDCRIVSPGPDARLIAILLKKKFAIHLADRDAGATVLDGWLFRE
jgi:hypothetical protein